MADEVMRLRDEIAQLQRTIDSLANIPDVQESLQAQLAAKRDALAKLTGQNPTAVAGNTTNIHGNVTGTVFSGSFSGPVTVGGTTVTQGPQINGAISAGRNVNIGTEQTIINQGDSSQVNSILSNVTQLIGMTSHLDVQNADQLKTLVARLGVELQKYAMQHPEQVEEVAKRTESAVAEAIKPKADKEDVQYRLERLIKAATAVGGLLPFATQLADFIRKMVG